MDTHEFKPSDNPRTRSCERCGRVEKHPRHVVVRIELPSPSAAEKMRAIGDTLQSEASRVVEWALGVNVLPYEVHQAALGVESAVEQWTEFRRTERA